MKTLIKCSLVLFSIFLAFNVYAAKEHMQDFANGQYRVHFNVFNSSLLNPDMASRYQIERAANLALINIVVQKKQADGRYKGVPAKVSVDQYDLIQHIDLPIKTINEGDVTYYLAIINIQHNIDNYFTIRAQVEGVTEPFIIKLKKRLYNDDKTR